MKKGLTIGLAVAVVVAPLSFVAASSFKREPVTEADALPAYEIVATVRGMGLKPISEPVRRGPSYVMQAYDPRGVQVRVVADAQSGGILSVAPARASNESSTPAYNRGPRIIHVPQPGERDVRASVNDRDEPAMSESDDDAETAPPPRSRATPPPRTAPRWAPQRSETPLPPQRRSDAPPPPPPGPRRAVLSAPPPPAEGPTPIRPMPRLDSKADSGEKFDHPLDSAATSRMPPPPAGYTPPAAWPQGN